MELHFNVTGAKRKELVGAMVGALRMAAVYKGAPTFAYAIGNFTVTKDGTLLFDERVTEEELLKVKEKLSEVGFTAEDPLTEAKEETTGLNIEVPRDSFTDEGIENLKRIRDSKEALFKKAFGNDSLEIKITDEKVSFPWFTVSTAEEVRAYTKFIEALCRMANEQKRVNATEKEVESEKFAMRCFLLRLGFIGAEFKTDRKILLKNLSGSAAFSTKEAADEFSAKMKAKREEKA